MGDHERLPPIDLKSFSGLLNENVDEFLDKFNITARIHYWKEQTKINLLTHFTTGYAYKWLKVYLDCSTVTQTWDILEQQFKKAFTHAHTKFDLEREIKTRIQHPDETPLQFYYVMRNLCFNYDSNMTHSLIIHNTLMGFLPHIFDRVVTYESKTLDEFQSNLMTLEKQLCLKQLHNKKFGISQTVNINNLISESNSKQLSSDIPSKTYTDTKNDFNFPQDSNVNIKYHRTNDKEGSSTYKQPEYTLPLLEQHLPTKTNNMFFNRTRYSRSDYNKLRTDSHQISRRYNCEICCRNNHSTIACVYNPNNNPPRKTTNNHYKQPVSNVTPEYQSAVSKNV